MVSEPSQATVNEWVPITGRRVIATAKEVLKKGTRPGCSAPLPVFHAASGFPETGFGASDCPPSSFSKSGGSSGVGGTSRKLADWAAVSRWNQLPHDAHQFVRKERFLQEFKTVVRLHVSGNQNDGHSRERFPDRAGKTQSIAIRHLDVADDQIYLATQLLHDPERLGAVFGFHRSKTLLLQNGADILSNGRFVIDYQRDRHTSLDGQCHFGVARNRPEYLLHRYVPEPLGENESKRGRVAKVLIPKR